LQWQRQQPKSSSLRILGLQTEFVFVDDNGNLPSGAPRQCLSRQRHKDGLSPQAVFSKKSIGAAIAVFSDSSACTDRQIVTEHQPFD
jgi:hypothetical protein